MGTWLAAKLAPHHAVTLAGRSERIHDLRTHGLTLDTLPAAAPDGRPRRDRVANIELINVETGLDRPAPRFDATVIAVRAYQTREAALWVHAAVHEAGALLTLQNGLGNAEILADVFSVSRVVAGTTSHGVTWLPPATARHAGAGDTTLGAWTPEAETAAQDWAAWLSAAGIATTVTDEPRAALWRKVAVNAAINPATTLYDVDNGALLDGGAREAEMVAAAREVAAVATAEGIPLDGVACAEAARRVAMRTAANMSSMRQAFRAGRALETDAILGETVRRGQQHSIATPTLSRLVAALAALPHPTPQPSNE